MGAKIFAETSIRHKAAESVLDDSSPIGSMHTPRDRFSGQIRVYFAEAKNAEHGFFFALRSELGSGSHSGHRLGCSDYNKCSVERICLVEGLLISLGQCESFDGRLRHIGENMITEICKLVQLLSSEDKLKYLLTQA